MYTFRWFDTSELKKYSFIFLNPNEINNILEIGSYEGLSSSYFSDNFLSRNESSLTCVEPFDLNDSTSPLYDGIYFNFINNVKNSKNWNKIRLYQLFSNDFFKVNKKKFNFIYIDGSHLINDIISDFENSIKCITNNGIIWMDDYLGGDNNEIKKCIDDLYEKYKNNLIIIHYGYQIAFRCVF